jgi:hypothetical protein
MTLFIHQLRLYYVYTHTHTHTYTYIHICIYIICVYIHVYYIYIYMAYICMCTWHIYIYIYGIYIHICHMYIYMAGHTSYISGAYIMCVCVCVCVCVYMTYIYTWHGRTHFIHQWRLMWLAEDICREQPDPVTNRTAFRCSNKTVDIFDPSFAMPQSADVTYECPQAKILKITRLSPI